MSKELTQREMLADLMATFPALNAYPLGNWAGSEWADSNGIRVACDDEVRMPDGLPMMTCDASMQGLDEMDGPMHAAFYAWLSLRGWYYENYDGVTLFLLPASLIPDYQSTPPAPTDGVSPAYGDCPF